MIWFCKMNKKKLLITGSCGFKFSNFIRYVLKNKTEYSVVSIDSIKDQKHLNSIFSNKGHTFYMGDITDTNFVNNVFSIEKPDVVIHGAEENISPHIETIKTNVLGTQILLNAAKDNGTEHFILSSSAKVYGNLQLSFKEEDAAAFRVNNTYTSSKFSAELFVQSSGLKYNIIRPSNLYGPKQGIHNLIPTIIATLLLKSDKDNVLLYGKGEHTREWTHIQDFCQGILDIIEKGKENEIYNISSEQEFSNIEVFQEICNVFKNEYNLDCYNKVQFMDDIYNSNLRRSLNNQKLLSIGFEPKFKFKESIKSVVQWYNNNQWYIR